MARQNINVGTNANDATGDTLRVAFGKVNNNFIELYTTGGVQGVQGTTGSSGGSGSQGIQGISGSQGIQGIFGTQGVIGSQGIEGTLGAQGIQGILGSQGIQGTLGIQGVQGASGAGSSTGNIAFSDVTIYPNTNSNVTISSAISGANASIVLPADDVTNESLEINNLIEGGGIHLNTANGSLLFTHDNILSLPATGKIYTNKIETESEYTALTLGFDVGSTANGKYLQLRGGDDPEHIHVDTGNNSGYDQIWGDDSKYLKLSKDGNVIIRAYDSANAAGNTWTFAPSGSLTFPDSTTQNTAGIVPDNIIINDSGFYLDGGTGTYWSGQSGVAQTGDEKGGVYREISKANNALFTFSANGAGYMSVGVDGSLFLGTAKPSNDGGVTTAFPGWLVVQNGGKFGAGIDTLGSLLVGGGVYEKYQTKNDATGTVEHDCTLGNIFYHDSPDANWTANFTNTSFGANYATTFTLVINQGATGYYASSVQIGGAAQTIKWLNNTTPVPSTNRVDVLTFSVLYNGSSYIVLGQMTGF